MSYRKITVNDKIYEYTVGKKNIKILLSKKLVGVWNKSEVGNPIVDNYFGKETGEYLVTPLIIRNLILGNDLPGNNTPIYYTCGCDLNTRTTKLTHNPYSVEIHGKAYLTIYCPQCVQRLAWDI